ncbi:hypothetical protein HanPI659440_Chr14g0564421 [Helianthus annuus]|nr:hypothetical protein HanPI659440_Chr14g0564421 [Helianthus annuus]
MPGNGNSGSPGESSGVTVLGNRSKWVKIYIYSAAFWAVGNPSPTPILPVADALLNEPEGPTPKPTAYAFCNRCHFWLCVADAREGRHRRHSLGSFF